MRLLAALLLMIAAAVPVSAQQAGSSKPLSAQQADSSKRPALLIGNFTDDYNISYTISDKRFQLGPNTIYNILEWNNKEHFIIAQADSTNKVDALKWVRIDWMEFKDMPPYKWGFCLTTWTASTADQARQTQAANRQSPRDGCGGYPFSRMKPVAN